MQKTLVERVEKYRIVFTPQELRKNKLQSTYDIEYIYIEKSTEPTIYIYDGFGYRVKNIKLINKILDEVENGRFNKD